MSKSLNPDSIHAIATDGQGNTVEVTLTLEQSAKVREGLVGGYSIGNVPVEELPEAES